MNKWNRLLATLDQVFGMNSLEHGFLRMRCESCHREHLVAFS